jgi:S-formylglutathione hydrolase FrmB
VERVFPALKKRSGRCVGGLSMGGYGALRLALANPEMFVSANSHSGATQAGHKVILKDAEFHRVFGPKARGSDHDLFALVAKLKRKRLPIPKLHIDCGTDDFLLHDNRVFHQYLVKIGVQHEYAEYPGTHEWGYWDLHIREALTFHCRALGIA